MKEIFIHKEDLPKSCFDCPFYDGDSDFPNMFCDVNCELLDSYKVDISTDRHENCPIKIIEEAKLEDKFENGQLVKLPCKVGDTVYVVGNYDCMQGHTEDRKLQRKIYLHCVKLGGDCDRCKYAIPAMEDFVCTHIQISTKGILVCGEKCQGYLSDRIFTDKEQAEARLKELQREQKNG